jgi:hypothetical protein
MRLARIRTLRIVFATGCHAALRGEAVSFARARINILPVLAALLLSGILSVFPHGHSTGGFAGRLSGELPESGATLSPLGSDGTRNEAAGADGCPICFFSRLVSHGRITEARLPGVSLPQSWISLVPGAIFESFLASWIEARGPPSV